MRAIAAFVWLLLLQTGLLAQTGPLLIVRQNHRSGLIDTTGKIILPIQYDAVIKDTKSQLFIVQNGAKEALFNPVSMNFSTGFFEKVEFDSTFRYIVSNGTVSGVTDGLGNYIVPLKYTQGVRVIVGKYACFDSNGLDFYNRDGVWLSHIDADDIIDLKYAAIVVRNQKFGLCGSDGQLLLSTQWDRYNVLGRVVEFANEDSVAYFHTDLNRIVVAKAGTELRFLIDELDGVTALPFYIKKIDIHRTGMSVFNGSAVAVDLNGASIRSTGLSGHYIHSQEYSIIIDSLGNRLTAESYDNIWYLGEHCFRVRKLDMNGIFDLDSGLVVPMEFADIRMLFDSVTGKRWFKVFKNGSWQLMNSNFQLANNLFFSEIVLYDGRGFSGTIEGGALMLDTNGRQMCRPVYSSLRPIQDGLWKVSTIGFSGLMDDRGTELLKPVYNDIEIRNGRIKAVRSRVASLFSWDGKKITPLMNFSNFRRLSVNGTLEGQTITPFTIMGPYRWLKDSVSNKFGLWSTSLRQWSIQPTYDYVKMDDDKEISLTGVFGDTTWFKIGPLTFYGLITFGVVDHINSRIIAPNNYAHIYFSSFLPRYYNGKRNRPTARYYTPSNVAIAIDSSGAFKTISYEGTRYNPNVQFIDRLSSSAKAWKFDSAYVACSSKDKKICSVQRLYAPLKEFMRPADPFTDSIVNSSKKWNVYAVGTDSLVFEKTLNENLVKILSPVLPGNNPAFSYQFPYTRPLEFRIPDYINILVYSSQRRYTYIDSAGNMIHNPDFIRVAPFSEGVALVKHSSKYGYINKAGEMVIDEKFRRAAPFCEGKAAVSLKGGKYGYIGLDGEWVIEPVYREALDFSEGVAPVKPATLFGYIDESGRIVVKPEYLHAMPFKNGFAVVYKKSGFGLIDHSGKLILKPQFNKIGDPDSNGVRMVNRKKGWALVNAEGKRISSYSKVLTDAGNGYYSLKHGNEFDLLRGDGSVVGSFKSDRVIVVGNGLVMVSRKAKVFYCDMAGKDVLGPFERGYGFCCGLAVVSEKNRTFIMNTEGKEVKPLFNSKMSSGGIFDKNGLVVIRDHSIYMLVDTTGKTHFTGSEKPRYGGGDVYIFEKEFGCYLYNFRTGVSYFHSAWSNIQPSVDGRFVVTINGLTGFADSYGQYYVKPAYTRIERVANGIYRVYYGDNCGYLKYDGTVIWEPSR